MDARKTVYWLPLFPAVALVALKFLILGDQIRLSHSPTVAVRNSVVLLLDIAAVVAVLIVRIRTRVVAWKLTVAALIVVVSTIPLTLMMVALSF